MNWVRTVRIKPLVHHTLASYLVLLCYLQIWKIRFKPILLIFFASALSRPWPWLLTDICFHPFVHSKLKETSEKRWKQKNPHFSRVRFKAWWGGRFWNASNIKNNCSKYVKRCRKRGLMKCATDDRGDCTRRYVSAAAASKRCCILADWPSTQVGLLQKKFDTFVSTLLYNFTF